MFSTQNQKLFSVVLEKFYSLCDEKKRNERNQSGSEAYAHVSSCILEQCSLVSRPMLLPFCKISLMLNNNDYENLGGKLIKLSFSST